jgi:2-haloacid dehalogenase
MSVNRRTVLMQLTAATIGSAAWSSHSVAKDSNFKAIAFDAFPIFDPRPIFASCERVFPGHGAQLADLWRTRQFEYQWLRALGGRYRNFWDATQDALVFSCSALNLPLDSQQRAALMDGYLQLKAWPDVAAALQTLRKSGLKIAFLSNATTEILEHGLENSNLKSSFDAIISTDRIRSFKPDPRAYQLGVDVLGYKKDEILFVAFAGWDVAGAKWFGYQTFWNNRQTATSEELDATPDGRGASLDELIRFLKLA